MLFLYFGTESLPDPVSQSLMCCCCPRLARERGSSRLEARKSRKGPALSLMHSFAAESLRKLKHLLHDNIPAILYMLAVCAGSVSNISLVTSISRALTIHVARLAPAPVKLLPIIRSLVEVPVPL